MTTQLGKCSHFFFSVDQVSSSRGSSLVLLRSSQVSYEVTASSRKEEMMRDHHLELLERRRRRRHHLRDDDGGGGGRGEGGSAAKQRQRQDRRRCWNLSNNVLATAVVVAAATIVSNWAGVNCQGEFRRWKMRGNPIYHLPPRWRRRWQYFAVLRANIAWSQRRPKTGPMATTTTTKTSFFVKFVLRFYRS